MLIPVKIGACYKQDRSFVLSCMQVIWSDKMRGQAGHLAGAPKQTSVA